MVEILGREQKIKLLQTFIRRGLSEGLSATRMYEQIRGTALGIRKKDFLDLVRGIRGVQKKAEDTIKYTRTEYLFPKGVDVVDWDLKRPFLYRFSVLFEGEEKPRLFSTYSDRPMLVRDALESALSTIEGWSEGYKEEIDILGKDIVSIDILAPAVSREFSPSWLKRRFGF